MVQPKKKSSPGAPTKDDEQKYCIPIHFAVTKAEKEELDHIVKETCLTQSALMRFALKKLFKDYIQLVPEKNK